MTCKGCRKTTRDYVTSFLRDGRRLFFCRERNCAAAWLAATR